ETGLTLLEQDFEPALAAIPSGYGEGVYEGLRYGVTGRKSRDGKRTSLFARALAALRSLLFGRRDGLRSDGGRYQQRSSVQIASNCGTPAPRQRLCGDICAMCSLLQSKPLPGRPLSPRPVSGSSRL